MLLRLSLCCACTAWPAPALQHRAARVSRCGAQDLGHGGIQANNPLVKGPRVAELKSEGLYLSRHYVYKFCSPTRGSFLVMHRTHAGAQLPRTRIGK
jgi:arylsulfatase B